MEANIAEVKIRWKQTLPRLKSDGSKHCRGENQMEANIAEVKIRWKQTLLR